MIVLNKPDYLSIVIRISQLHILFSQVSINTHVLNKPDYSVIVISRISPLLIGVLYLYFGQ